MDRRARRAALARVAVACTAAACAALACGGEAEPEAPPAPAPVAVETAPVVLDDLQEMANGVGTLLAGETVEIRPEIATRIEEVAFEEGQRVEPEQLLYRLEDQELRARLAARQAELRAAEAARVEAQKRLERLRELARRDVASPAQLDEVVAQAESAAADVERVQAEIEELRDLLGDAAIRAPIGDEISKSQVDAGDFVQVGDLLATIFQLDPIEIQFTLPERWHARVREDQPVELEVPSAENTRLTGRVVFVSPSVDPSSRNFEVRARVANDGQVPPGSFARARVQVEERSARPVIPEKALVTTREGYVVFVVEEGVARQRPIEIGLREPGRVEVLEGLEAGERVVVQGQLSCASRTAPRWRRSAPRATASSDDLELLHRPAGADGRDLRRGRHLRRAGLPPDAGAREPGHRLSDRQRERRVSGRRAGGARDGGDRAARGGDQHDRGPEGAHLHRARAGGAGDRGVRALARHRRGRAGRPRPRAAHPPGAPGRHRGAARQQARPGGPGDHVDRVHRQRALGRGGALGVRRGRGEGAPGDDPGRGPRPDRRRAALRGAHPARPDPPGRAPARRHRRRGRDPAQQRRHPVGTRGEPHPRVPGEGSRPVRGGGALQRPDRRRSRRPARAARRRGRGGGGRRERPTARALLRRARGRRGHREAERREHRRARRRRPRAHGRARARLPAERRLRRMRRSAEVRTP